MALPIDVAGRALVGALRRSGRTPLVALVDRGEEALARAIEPGFVDVLVRPAPDQIGPDVAHALALVARAHPPAASLASSLADLMREPVVQLGARCEVVARNAAAERLGVEPGSSCAVVVPDGGDCASRPCLAARAREAAAPVRELLVRDGRPVEAVASPLPDGTILYREVDAAPLRALEERLEGSLRSLADANGELHARALCLERVVRAASELESAASREQLSDRVLGVLSDLPGFNLVAIGVRDEERGATEVLGLAKLPGGVTVPLGRRTVLLDLLNLSPGRRRVSNSEVIEGWSISVHGSPDTWGPRTAQGEWDLCELFDGSAVALTPLRASGRSHGFLLVKAEGGSRMEADDLRVVEILASLAAIGFDNLRLQDAERRRAAVTGMVSRLGRALLDVHHPDAVLDMAAEALRSVLDGATVAVERVRETRERAAPGSILLGPRILKAGSEPLPAMAAMGLPSAQLLVPVRAGDRTRAILSATSSARGAFDHLDLPALEVFSKVVGKAHANADAFAEEQRSLARLQMVAEVGRIASSSLEMEEVLARALGHLCQHGPCERAAVALVDAVRGKLVLRAQASRTGARVVDGLSTRLSEGVSGAVARSGQAMNVPDVSREPRYIAIDGSVRSELCVPLRAAGQVIGVLDVESTRIAAFDDADVVAVAAAGDHLAHALQNGRLFREVSDKNRELRESERNKSEFLSIVAHDLRTPLTSIRSAADVVLMYRDEPPEVTGEFLRSIRDEAARLGRLVDDFLAHSRMEAGILDYVVGEVDLPRLIEHFVRVFEGPAAQKRQALEWAAPAGLPLVLGDQERLSQVLSNLLSNATRYTPEGGRVTVSASPVAAAPGQVLGHVRVDVSDDGPGIHERDREKVFDKFVRLDGAKGGGAGLGLPIARAIVEHLGGRMWLDSAPGRGATFSFTVPAIHGGARHGR